MSLAGSVPSEVLDTIKEKFSRLPTKNNKPTIQKPDFHTGKLTRQKETEQAHLCLGFPGLPIGDSQTYALVLLNNVLGGSMSSRLFQEIREERGLAYSIFSYHSSFQDDGMLTIYGGTGRDQLDQLFEQTIQCINALTKEGLTEKELENGKEQLKGNLVLSLESTNSRMSRNGKHELMLGYHRSIDEVMDEIEKVQMDDIMNVAQKVFQEDFALSLISNDGKLPSSLLTY